jgi:hypothetical protein
VVVVVARVVVVVGAIVVVVVVVVGAVVVVGDSVEAVGPSFDVVQAAASRTIASRAVRVMAFPFHPIVSRGGYRRDLEG